MKLSITAKPKSRKEYLKRIDTTHYIVAVKEPPVGGKANNTILKSLAEYFRLPLSQLNIVTGEKNKHKIIEINLTESELKKIEADKELQRSLFRR
jgi:uncharacterized protein